MRLLAGILGLIMLLAASVCAQERDDIYLDRIVVTPYRYAEEIANAPTNVTKINQDEIRRSNGQRVIDILRPVTGLVVGDYYGNGAKASVDIRGFGEQARLNVLVLVDGRRANDVDQSGVDWSQIPLNQVESIEIIRGGSGGVLYGDNAVSGVINILTKTPRGKPQTDMNVKYGSYDSNGQSLSIGGSTDKLSYMLQASREGTHGYRNNSYYKAENFLSKIGFEATDDLALRFSSGYYKSSYGLPASLTEANIDAFNRRYARRAKDYANNKDYYFLLGAKNEFDGFGYLDLDASFRRKEVDSYFLSTGLNTLRATINTFGITPKYVLDRHLFSRDNKFIVGLDYYRSDYSQDAFGPADGILKNFTDTNKISLAGYLQDEFYLLDKLILVGGFRYEGVKFEFDYHDNTGANPDIDRNIRPNRKAFNSGLIYTYKKNSKLFANISRSFRFPEVDEFTYNDINWQQQLNTSLKPQTSTNFETGISHEFFDGLNSSLTLFRMNLKNELYFNYTGGPLGAGQNENYDKTYHEGFEFSADCDIFKKFILFGNYTYTKAVFDGGLYANNDIPLVPRNKGSVGLRWPVAKNLNFNLVGNYVGKRYYLNDQSNAQSKLNSYMTADTNLSYTLKDFTVIFGINNIFNKKYSEFAGYNGFTGQKFYYPSPERNFTLQMDYKF